MVSKEEFDAYKKTLVSEKDKNAYNKSIKTIRLVRYLLWLAEVVIAVIVLALNLPNFNRMASTGMTAVISTLVVFFVLFMFTFAITKIIERSKLEKIRKDVVPKMVQFLLGEQLNSFSVEGFLPKEDFKSAGFAGSFDDYKGEDLIDIDIPKDNGQRSEVSFKACDLRVTKEVRDSDGDTHDVTVYLGTFCAVNFPFEFKCKLAINSTLSGVKKFKLEDVSFNKKFQVFSNDKVEALCILTPTMMQKLVKLAEKTRNLKVSIFGNRLYLGFPGFNLFEFGKSKDGFSENMFNAIYDDVALLTAIIDEIKNNNKVFKI